MKSENRLLLKRRRRHSQDERKVGMLSILGGKAKVNKACVFSKGKGKGKKEGEGEKSK